jgi:NADPH2:quinone reductase
MREYGGPSVLRPEAVPLPPVAPGEVRIRARASAINHSDLEVRAGKWPIRRTPPFPYVPGIEVVGEVSALGSGVTDVAIGDRVVTMMQGLGGVRAERPGGYAEYVTVPAGAVAPVPDVVDDEAMAALGLGAVTAYAGLRRIGELRGRRIVVTGAAGGVGSSAVALARAQGATVVALINRREQIEYVRALGAGEVVLSVDVDRGALPARSVDGVLDTVGGAAFGTVVDALREDAVLSLVGAVGGSRVSLDGYRLLDATLTGFTSERLDGPGLRAAVAAIGRWAAQDDFVRPTYTTMPLDRAADAHALLEARGVAGRVLLVPA